MKQICGIKLALALWLLGAFAFAANLRQTPFPDGTGSIGLPEGWQIGYNYRGTVSCTGGNGLSVVLGYPWTIIPPNSSIIDLQGVQQQQAIARQGDVLTALKEVLTKRAGARLLSVRSRTAPASVAGVPAYYLMYEFSDKGVRYTAIGYFTSLIYGVQDPWQLYASAIIAPTNSFVRNYPTLMAIWRSWKPNGQEPIASSQSGQIDELLRKRRERLDQMQEAFRQVL